MRFPIDFRFLSNYIAHLSLFGFICSFSGRALHQIKPQLKYLPALQCTRDTKGAIVRISSLCIWVCHEKLVTRSNPYVYVQFMVSVARAYLLCMCDASDRLEC